MRDLVVRLTKRNAAAVTFDILFAEPDRTSLEEVVKHLPPDQANRLPGMAGFPTNDELFAEALKAAPSVLSILTGSASFPAFAPKVGFVFAGDDPKPFLRTFQGAEGNLPQLDDAARGTGSMNLFPNRDGVVRQVPLFFRLGDRIVPSLAAEALRVAQGASTYVLKSSNASGETAFGQSTGLNHVTHRQYRGCHRCRRCAHAQIPPKQSVGLHSGLELLAGEIDESKIAVRSFSLGPARPVCLTCGRHPSTLPCPVSRFRRRSLKTSLLDAGSRVPTML